MTKQEMMLPLNCKTHTHAGYGSSSDVPCPWCEIARLRGQLELIARSSEFKGLSDVTPFEWVQWAGKTARDALSAASSAEPEKQP